MRGRFIDVVLLAFAIAAAAWLGSLVYHNRFGGHVVRTASSWQGSVRTDGDVTTVVNESGSVWGGTAMLVEEASIGVGAGAEEYMLGELTGIAANDEHIYVVDRSVPVVRVYDYDGSHAMDVGSRGQGPGEFNNPRSVAVADDGRLFVFADRRINVYSSDGTPLETWPHGSALDSVVPPVLGDDGKLYLSDLIGETYDVLAWQHGMIAAGPEGPRGEHIPVPAMAYERERLLQRFPGGGTLDARIPFSPRLLWVMAPSRAIIVGVPDEYRFEIHGIDGAVTVVERFWDPVPVTPEEAEWTRERIIADRRRDDPSWDWNGPPIRDHKPAYEALFSGAAGRVWAARIIGTERVADCDQDPAAPTGRLVRPCWRQRFGFDVFDPTGRFLGQAVLPGDILLQHAVMRGDNLIGYSEDDDGVGHVKHYRLVLPTGG